MQLLRVRRLLIDQCNRKAPPPTEDALVSTPHIVYASQSPGAGAVPPHVLVELQGGRLVPVLCTLDELQHAIGMGLQSVEREDA